jgi:hypothetical protein
MKRTLVLLSLVLLTFTTRAEVMVERVSGTLRGVGAGVEFSARLGGFIVSDENGNGVGIETAIVRGRKLYAINRERSEAHSFELTGTGGRTYRVATKGVVVSNETQVIRVDGLLVKGLNTQLEISEATVLTRPRVARGRNHRLELVNGQPRLIEAEYTRTYFHSETRNANARGDDLETVVQRLLASLARQGFQPAN